MRISFGLLFLIAVNLAAQVPVRAEPSDNAPDGSVVDINLFSHGRSVFPLIWNAYRPVFLPPVKSNNGPTLSSYIRQGKLSLSLSQFLRLVIENNLTLEAARYNYLISQVDVLRARSGQATRGVPSVPVPGALFAGAIGAGVGNTANVNAGGTGGTAISGTARSVSLGPRGTFDPTISINMSWDRVVNPLNTTKVAGTSTVAIPSAVLQTRWQQELPFGTSYSISFNMQRQTTTQAHILYNPAFTSFLSIAVYHPLLNGAGRDYTQRFVSLAENDRRMAYEAFHTDLTNALSAAADAYWDFVSLREKERLAEQALALAQRTYEGTKQRIDIGTVAANELVTAESQVAARRRDLVVAQTNTQLQEITIKGLITKMISADIARIPFEPADTLSSLIDTPLPPLEDALRSAMRRSSIRQAELGLENQRIAETFTNSNLRPTLSAFTQINSYTLAPGMSGMFKQMFDYAYPEFAVGLTLTFPVKNRAAQADDVRARLELQQARVAFEQTKAIVGIQVRTALTNSTQTRAQIDAAHRAVEASQRTANGERDRWDAGVSTLGNVLQAQLDLATAQTAEIQARVDHGKAVIAQEVAVGSFLENHGINFDDALKGSLWKGSVSSSMDEAK